MTGEGEEKRLDWDAFSSRYFPGGRRHDLVAVAAYGAYKEGRDWQNSGRAATPPRLTLVPNDPVHEDDPEEPGMERLLVAVAAEQVWEGEGGFTP
jgi:hypothetical protein